MKTFNRVKYRTLLNQAMQEALTLQKWEAIKHDVQQICAKQKAKVLALQKEAEEIEKSRLLEINPPIPTRKIRTTINIIGEAPGAKESFTPKEREKLRSLFPLTSDQRKLGI